MTLKFQKLSITNFLHDETGVALIEFVAFLPVLLILFSGVIEFSLAMYEWSQINRLTQKAALYVIKNANYLYASDPFSSSDIVAQTGKSIYGDPIQVAAGCGCASTGTPIKLSPFGTAPAPKCSTSRVCNGSSSPMSPYVFLSAQHKHKTIIGNWNIGTLRSETIIRIQ